jgi:hypothetical protein
MTRKTIIATAALGTTLALGAIGLGTAVLPSVAGAQGTDTTQVASDSSILGRHPVLRHVAREEFGLAADTIGVPAKELRSDLKDGQSIAEVATAKGVDPTTVVNAVVGDLDTKLDTAVTNGKITQERADAVKARLPERITNLVNRHRGDHAAAQPGN